MPARSGARPFLHPLHAIFLAFPIAMFTGALASDVAYLNTAEIQWSNFSSWFLVGALIFGGFAALWALIAWATGRRGGRSRRLVFFVVVAAMWVVGLFNAFQHSHDAWASVGTTGLLLSILSTILALVAGWIGYSASRDGDIA